MAYSVRITDIKQLTHDVRQLRFEKPDGYVFEPGQATEVAIDRDGWREKKRPFTFTSLNDDSYLEFTIKIYPDHHGVTEQIGELEEGDSFLIDDPWGTIQYKGPGVFLAGGAGVTPFIAILRSLREKGDLEGNRLIFSNKTEKDIILRGEFHEMLGDDFVNVITHEETQRYHHGLIDKDFLSGQIDDVEQPFYVCGPKPFNEAMMGYLKELGADPDALVFEE
ncbi:MAG: FAD-binding oxidoreductase [Balneolaceae bacterium]|nr:FAD-binding oxidoreductase [Balneolaceae bacterium]